MSEYEQAATVGLERVDAVRARDLADTHHTTLLADASGQSAGVIPDLDRYLQRAAQLRANDGLFQKIEIEVSLGCNRRCTYCNLAFDRRENYVQARSKRMEWGLYARLISQLSDLQFEGVVCFHFYAEPLLNKKLGDYVALVRDELPRTQRVLYTNGDYLDAGRHAELTRAGMTLFFVTRHDNQIPAALEPVLARSNTVLDARAWMTLNNRAGDLGASGDVRIRSLPCIYTSESIIVTIDGNVLPCSCDFRETMRFGNIRESHLRDIYASPACRTFRADLLQGRREQYTLCKDCDVYGDVLGARSAAEPHRERQQPLSSDLRKARSAGHEQR